MGTVQKIENDESIESINKKIDKKKCDATKTELKLDSNNVQTLPSMTSLIIWNISKVLEIVPDIDIKGGLKAAQERLQHDSGNVISQKPEEQHFMCALLAWHKLGHSNTDSLLEFVKAKKATDLTEPAVNKFKEMNRPRSFIIAANSINANYSYDSEQIDSISLEAYSKGPVIKLPTETKLIMRVDQPDKICCNRSRPKETTKKLDDACCMDTACSEQLAKMDEETEKLRTRAKLLAKREAHRVELLERAEAAWKDLERGYQRRLTLAEEKEEDIAKQIKKIAEERNEYKKACTTLTDELTERGKEAENVRAKLKEVEAELCNNACKRLKLSEKVAEVEAALADHQCKAVQLERDLELKEDQARRKVASYENETESARALTNEAERVLHAELSGLREQITEVSNQLLKEDEDNKKLKTELENLRQEKIAIIADLDGCQLLCDGKMKVQMDELQNKREQLLKLKETVLECQCKLPVDAAVMAKRTPSLAALCKCTADDRLLGESCSCTSVRSSVISNLLADLFAGLQSELGGARSDMPCKFLKCLEDQHNWDRASDIKSSLRNYFSKLLVEELNVAIATSIENYHARWVGPTCADLHRMIPGPEDDENKGWERRAIERKAQQLATKLAEDLYQQRAAELTKRAKEIVTSGPPPCKCDRKAKMQTETYPCLMESTTLIPNRALTPPPKQRTKVSPCGSYSPDPWRRTHRDVTQLKLEIEGLKKDAIKKKDLEIMEQKIANMVKRVTVPEHEDSTTKYNANIPLRNKKETKCIKTTDEMWKKTIPTKTSIIKKKPIEAYFKNKKSQICEKPTKQSKKFNYHQTYAVNLCLYEQKPNKSVHQSQLKLKNSPMNQKLSKEVLSQVSSFEKLKSISTIQSPEVNEMGSKVFTEPYCASNCKCLQKEPSNSSIDKLLEKLTKWKSDLGGSQEKIVNNINKSFSNKGSKRIFKTDNSKTNYLKEKDEKYNESQISKQKSVSEKKYQSIHNKEAFNTESEYIVAINLDKSMMNVYPDAFDKPEFEFKHPSSGAGIQYPQPCLDKVKLINENSYSKHTTKLHVLTNSKSIGAMPENRKEEEFSKEFNFHTDRKDKEDMLSKNLDYYIKFLGVTLADVNANQVQKRIVKNNHDKANNYSPPSSYTSKEHNEQYKNLMLQFDTPKFTSGQHNKPIKDKSNLSHNNNITTNIYNFNDQCNLKNSPSKDEALDSDSLKHSKNTLESCVCCNTKVLDYSKDLEVNTFNLLEVHLREKFNECHICSCNSACISSEKKEKIFGTTLNRVKQVISDCIKEVKCKETGNLSTGSWKRAYGLMQEYLKIKVKRAQRLSLSNKQEDKILPEILDTVCNLIENDFQRIKNICKCKKEDETTPTAPTVLDHKAVSNEELPVKDINVSFKQNATDTIKMVSQQNSPKSSILRINISSQIDYDLKKETKSFGVMVANDNIKNGNFVRKVSTEYCVKSLGLAESKPIAFIPNLPFQITPDVVIETKACDPLIDAHNIVKVISRTNLVNHVAVAQHTSTVPFSLEMANKACNANTIHNRVSTANSTQSVVPAQHMSSQVPSNLRMKTKSCDIMIKSKIGMVLKANSTNLEVPTNHTSCQVLPIFEVQTEADDIKTTSSESGQASQSNILIISEKKSRVIAYNDSTYFYNETESNLEALRDNQRSSVNILRKDGGVKIASKDINLCQNIGLRYVKSMPNFDFEENLTSEDNLSTKLCDKLPYIGYTVDCMCDSKLKSCTCAKSLIQKYVDKFSSYWQSFYNPNKPIQNCSYIMNGNLYNDKNENVNQKNDNLPLINVPIFIKQHSADKNACEAEINVRSEEDIVLLLPKQTVETGQRSTNTYVENATLITDTESEIPLSWCQCPPQSLSSNTRVSAESVYESTNDECMLSFVPSKDARSAGRFSYSFCKLNTESKLSSKSRSIDSDGTGTFENCTCDKVPLCHVKMLVENIEKNLKQGA